MNTTDTLETLREIRGLLDETEKHFLRECGWLCRVGDESAHEVRNFDAVAHRLLRESDRNTDREGRFAPCVRDPVLMHPGYTADNSRITAQSLQSQY